MYAITDRFRKRKTPDLNLPPLNPIYTTEPRYPTSWSPADMSPPMNYRPWDRPRLNVPAFNPLQSGRIRAPMLPEMTPPMTPPEDEDALRQEAEELERMERETVETEERHRQFELQKETKKIEIETKNLKAKNARIEAQQKALENAARSPVTGRSAGGAPSREDVERRYMSRYGEPPPEGWWTEEREPYAEGLEAPLTRQELLERGIEGYAKRHPAGREREIAGIITGRREDEYARIHAKAEEARKRRLEEKPPTEWDIMRHRERLATQPPAMYGPPTTAGEEGVFPPGTVTQRGPTGRVSVLERPEAPEAPTRGVITIALGLDGKPHRLLVDPTTGKTIQDLGVAEAPEAPGMYGPPMTAGEGEVFSPGTTYQTGPTGRVTLLGKAPEELPEEYKTDLSNAVSATAKGADKVKVYQRIAKKYPRRSAEIKRILLARDPEKALFDFGGLIHR